MLREAFPHMDSAQRHQGRDAGELPVRLCTSLGITCHLGIARAKACLSPDLRTLTGTGLPITAEHVALGTLTGEGRVCVDAGVFATMVAQQAIISPCKIQQSGEVVSEASGLFYPTSPPSLPSPGDIPLISLEQRGKERGARHCLSSAVLTLFTPAANFPHQRRGRGTHGSRS